MSVTQGPRLPGGIGASESDSHHIPVFPRCHSEKRTSFSTEGQKAPPVSQVSDLNSSPPWVTVVTLGNNSPPRQLYLNELCKFKGASA